MALNPFSLLRPITVSDTGSFARSTTATYYDATGYRQSALANTPRFSYDPTTLAPNGALLETAATNLLAYSNDFTQAAWTKSSVTPTTAAGLGADNTTSMNLLTAVAASAQHFASQSFTVTANAPYACAVDVKSFGSGNCTHAQILYDDGSGNGASVNVRLADGVVTASGNRGTGVNGSFFVQLLQNGVIRVTVSGQSASTTGRFLVAMLDTTNAAAMTIPTITFAVTDKMYVSAAQAEAGAVASSYFATTTTSAARAADSYAGVMMLSNVAEVAGTSDPAAWNGATAYTAGQQVSRIITNGIHKVYQRLISGTTATAPESDATNWVYVGPTNRWKMFDAANETQTSNSNDIQVMLQPGALCDSVAFDNLYGDTIQVKVQDSTYDQTIQLKTRACATWFQYFFEPFKFKKTAVFTDLPLVTTNVIHVIVRKATLTALAGTAVPTLQRVIGYAEPGATTGIIDYSVRSTDQFGSTTVVQRSYSKRMQLSVIIDNSDLDAVQDLLASYRAVPVVWQGASNAYGALTMYGYYKSFDIVIAYPTQSRCNLDIEGVT